MYNSFKKGQLIATQIDGLCFCSNCFAIILNTITIGHDMSSLVLNGQASQTLLVGLVRTGTLTSMARSGQAKLTAAAVCSRTCVRSLKKLKFIETSS